jgi:hypothetical protein
MTDALTGEHQKLSGALVPASPRSVTVPRCAEMIPARMTASREAARERRSSAVQRLALERVVQRLIAVDVRFDLQRQERISSAREIRVDFDTRLPKLSPFVKKKDQPAEKAEMSASRPGSSSSPRNVVSARQLAAQAVRARERNRSQSKRKKRALRKVIAGEQQSVHQEDEKKEQACSENQEANPQANQQPSRGSSTSSGSNRSRSSTSNSSSSFSSDEARARDPSIEP